MAGGAEAFVTLRKYEADLQQIYKRLAASGLLPASLASVILFSAYASAAQLNLADNTWTTIVLGTELFDVGGNFAANTFTAPQAGYYLFTACVGFIQPHSQSVHGARIYKSNAVARVLGRALSEAGSQANCVTPNIGVSVAAIVNLAAADTVVLQAWVDANAAASVDIDFGNGLTCFQGIFLST